ncbi:MAG: hypothetical protein SWX82_28690 [Cyanobacteriota bacterium]|nr:hypothetical protein [Cyanobacteriota bacterium]
MWGVTGGVGSVGSVGSDRRCGEVGALFYLLGVRSLSWSAFPWRGDLLLRKVNEDNLYSINT